MSYKYVSLRTKCKAEQKYKSGNLEDFKLYK